MSLRSLKAIIKRSVAVYLLCTFFSVTPAFATALLGPQQFVRENGGTTTFNETFSATPGPARLYILNGEVIGEDRVDNVVSSARVLVNNEEIFVQSDFKKYIYVLEALVQLNAGDNTITVEINGKPGTFLTVSVTRPSVVLNADPATIPSGDSSLLTWNVAHGSYCVIEPGLGTHGTSGSVAVAPLETTTYTVTAVDSQGNTASGSATVRVNQPPAAIDRTISTTEDTVLALTLTATDPENDPLTFQVTSLPSHGTLSGTAPNLSYLPSQNFHGTDSFTFVANDGVADSTEATISITITPVNDDPVAEAGSDQTVQRLDTVSLDGTGSSDIDNDPLSYQWTITTAPVGSSATIAAIDQPTTSFVPDLAGDYTVRLIVNDGTVDGIADQLAVTATLRTVTVPNIVGIALQDVESSLAAVLLVPGTITSSYDNTVPAGQVISQGLVAGSSVIEQTPVTIVVSLGPVPRPTASLSIAPDTGTHGQYFVLSWITTNADTVTLDQGINTVPESGSITVTPTETTTYTLTAVGPGGIATDAATVTITAALPEGALLGVSPDAPSPDLMGNGISIISGNVFESRTDISLASANRNGFALNGFYNSQADASSAMGYGWSHSYSETLDPAIVFNGNTYLRIIDATGRAVYFSEETPGVYQGAFDEKSSVKLESGNFVRYMLDGSTSGFDSTGRLLWLADALGNRIDLAYDAQDRMTTATDTTTSRVLTFAYNTENLISSIIGPVVQNIPDGVWVTYGYDANSNLTDVTYADGSGVIYEYTDPADTHNLTAKRDKENHLLNSWSYGGDKADTGTDLFGQSVVVDAISDTLVEVTDAYNVTRSYTLATVDGRTRLASMQGTAVAPYASDNVVRWQYDNNGNLEEEEDASGLIIRYENYDSRGNPGIVRIAVGSPLERVITITYHPVLNAPLTISEPSVLGAGIKKTVFDYDNDGNTIANENPTNLISRVVNTGFTHSIAGGVVAYEYITGYAYNAQGRVTDIDGPRPGTGDTTTFIYDPVTGDLLSITRPHIGATFFTEYDASGQPGKMIDVNNQTTTYTYDGRGRILNKGNLADSSASTYGYTLSGELSSMIDEDDVATNYEYYPISGRLFKTVDMEGNYIQRNYDAQGNLIESSKHNSLDVRSSRNRWDYQHPTIPGLLYKTINGNDSFIEYDYYADGTVSSVTDAENNTTGYIYDDLNRLKEEVQPDNQGSISYTYDAHGNIASVTDPENFATLFTFDDMGRKVREESPDRGVIRTVYDEAGNMVYKLDARGIVNEYTYDNLNRPTGVLYATSSNNITFVYDQGVNGMGRRTSIIDPSGTLSFAYDNRGRLVGKIQAMSEDSRFVFTMSRVFSPGNRVLQQTLPSGRVMDYTRDAQGRLTYLTTDQAGIPHALISNMTYRPFGGPAGLENGSGGTVDNQYGDCGCGVTVANPGATMEMRYGYDNNKNLTSITAPNVPRLNRSYSYDSLNRLTSADGPWGNIGYTYDNAGNRLTRTKNGQEDIYSYQIDNNRLDQTTGQVPTAYIYDDNGNITNKGAMELYYDVNNLIELATTNGVGARYQYNALNQRVAKYERRNFWYSYIYDFDGNLVAESDGGGTVTKEYLYMGSNRLAMVDNASGEIYTYLNDRLGTPIMMTDSTNTVVWEATYTPFGEATINPNSTVENNFRFPGQYYDEETGLHYNWHRYYDPSTGRYLTPDPIGLKGGINLFLYAGANPINAIDPFGLKLYNVVIIGSGANVFGHNLTLHVDDANNKATYYEVTGPDTNNVSVNARGQREFNDAYSGRTGVINNPTQSSRNYDVIEVQGVDEGAVLNHLNRQRQIYHQEESIFNYPYTPQYSNCTTFSYDAYKTGGKEFTPEPNNFGENPMRYPRDLNQAIRYHNSLP